MDLIDRYVAAVRRHLPRKLQDDVIQELTGNLRSEAEEREEAEGHALTEDEQAALLKRHGHPWLMASKYLPQQQLIGPGLYPYYRQALGFVLFWVVVPTTLFGGAIAAIYSDAPVQTWIIHALPSAWNGAIYSIGIVTVVFAVLEHERVRITALDNWNPAKLPNPSTERIIPRSETLPGLIAMLTFLVWWAGLIRLPSFTEYSGVAVKLVAAPVWSQIYWPVLISLIAGIAVALIDLMRPWRSLVVSVVDIAINLFNVTVIVFIIRAGHYVDVIGDAPNADKLTRADYWMNASISWTFMVLGAVVLLDVLYEIWQITHKRPRTTAMAV
jgi:hypothetical protein